MDGSLSLPKGFPCFLVVMAGGSGTRFWPKSTLTQPKQLLSFHPKGLPLLVETLRRFEAWIPPERRFVLTTYALQAAVEDLLATHKIGARLLLEPQSRNTAPCLYWAARVLAEQDPEAVMLVMPSDHYIGDVPTFLKGVQQAAAWAAHGSDLVTLGVSPTRAETGYGYLKIRSTEQAELSPEPPFRVLSFVEKPSLPRANEFFESKNYLWNAGMFVWKVSTLLQAFDQHLPEMRRAWEAHAGDLDQAYAQMPATSIDYGIMEKANRVVTFPLHCAWDDLGSWASLESMADILGIRQGENVVLSGELVASLYSYGNIIDLPGKKVALLEVQDLILVESGNQYLIASKKAAQRVRAVVEALEKANQSHPEG